MDASVLAQYTEIASSSFIWPDINLKINILFLSRLQWMIQESSFPTSDTQSYE